MASTAFSIVVFLSSVFLFDSWRRRRHHKYLKFPPGPKGNPLVGLLGTDIYYFSRIRKWRQEYGSYDTVSHIEGLILVLGDIISFSILGTRFVFIFSQDIASELLDKRAAKYSDRHSQTMILAQGWTFNIGLLNYGSWWRRHRRGFHQYFNSGIVKNYEPIQFKATRDLVQRLYQSPHEFENHVRYFTGAILLKIVYDYDLIRENDPYIKLIKSASEGNQNFLVGLNLVDLIPILKYVPQWFPGASWKRNAARIRKPVTEVNTLPFKMVKKAMENGTAGPSTTADSIIRMQSKRNLLPDDEEIVMNVSGISYAAGAGTGTTALMILIFDMMLNPEAQKKAQEELDNVLGDRLPTLEDRPNLPYIEAFCTESQRCQPVLPFGIAHATFDDDVYNDFFIPKGSVVIGVTQDILRDRKHYGQDAEDFVPERFSERGIQHPLAQWGYGRRMCPGRHLASGSNFLAVATILKLFDVIPAKDDKGNDIPISREYVGLGIIRPAPFKCSFRPRSAFAEKILSEGNLVNGT
ncbi:hypothetical protein M422DRAFT_247854 [Sphaerobolus stellatus SS14]|nr:hypothetical protein M422DRAFT_247854 [Sphaerobolus stellatus SS14]